MERSIICPRPRRATQRMIMAMSISSSVNPLDVLNGFIPKTSSFQLIFALPKGQKPYQERPDVNLCMIVSRLKKGEKIE